MTVVHLTEANPTFVAPYDCVVRAVEIALVDQTLPWDTYAFVCLSEEASQSADRNSWLFFQSAVRPAHTRGFWGDLELRLARGSVLGLVWGMGSIGFIEANIFFDPLRVVKLT